jgi:hypothetical protein
VQNQNQYAFNNIPAAKSTVSTIVGNSYFKISLKINLRGHLPAAQLLSKMTKKKRSRFFNGVKRIGRS